MLATRELPVKHTGENIAECLTEILQKFGIEEKVKFFTTDNAGNMRCAAAQANLEQKKCFVHTLVGYS